MRAARDKSSRANGTDTPPPAGIRKHPLPPQEPEQPRKPSNGGESRKK